MAWRFLRLCSALHAVPHGLREHLRYRHTTHRHKEAYLLKYVVGSLQQAVAEGVTASGLSQAIQAILDESGVASTAPSIMLIRITAALVPSLGWLISLPALLIAGLLAGLETWTRHDADAAELLRELKIDHLLGSFGVFSCALLFASLGLPEAEATALVAQDVSPDGGGLALAVSMAAGADQPVAVKAGAVAGASPVCSERQAAPHLVIDLSFRLPGLGPLGRRRAYLLPSRLLLFPQPDQDAGRTSTERKRKGGQVVARRGQRRRSQARDENKPKPGQGSQVF